MPRFASVGSTALALLALAGGARQVLGGEFLHHPFAAGCGPACGNPAQVVQLPAQSIVVETSRPRVILQDTTPSHKHSRAPRAERDEAPFVATVFAPLSATAPPPADTRTTDASSLALAHQVEFNLMLLHRAQAAQEAERQATQKALDRVAGALRDTSLSGTSSADCVSVTAQVKTLGERMERLETLVKAQGEVLKQQVGVGGK